MIMGKILKKSCEFMDKKQVRERIIKNCDDAVVITDNRAVVEMINPGFTKLFGYSEAEALGRPVNELINLEQPPTGFKKSKYRTFRGSTQKTIQSIKNGKKYGVQSSITPIMVNNKTVGSFACYRVLDN